MYGKFFKEIDTEEKAYFLGLLFADGHISTEEKKYKQVIIRLCEDDLSLLEKMSSIIECNEPVYTAPQANRYSTKGQFSLHLGREWDNLKDYAKKDILPNIQKDLLHHFVRGIFDGDGCISIDKRSLENENWKFVAGDFFILLNQIEHAEVIRSIICEAINAKPTKIVEKFGNGIVPVYKVRWGGTNKLISIREWLYRDATIYLERKKEKFNLITNGSKDPWNKGLKLINRGRPRK